MSTTSPGVPGVAARYAAALFDLAEERKELDIVADNLAAIRGMLAESADLRRLVSSPVIRREAQAAAIGAVLERAGTGDLVQRFVGTVARNRRLFALDGMCAAYRELLAARRNELTAEVTTAQPLTEVQRTALEDELRSAMGASIAIDARVDEGILGGMIVKIGSRMVDSSLQTKLQRLEFSLKGTA